MLGMTDRRIRFLNAVAEAARSRRPRKPRGRPTLANLTEEGRRKGLEGMKTAPRFRAKRRDGTPCRCLAMNGSSRCLKHGGRVQVTVHPHNVRRFFEGKSGLGERRTASPGEPQTGWAAMSTQERRAFIAMLPHHIAGNLNLVREAAQVWSSIEGSDYRAWARMIETLTRA
jgi:hypothetical protein